jgi:hypothetical protein
VLIIEVFEVILVALATLILGPFEAVLVAQVVVYLL